ncbi:hypothetical protein [Mycolicibacterium komossense]|uniref:Uncharacterized protein n=1 Tax=Mycolicibacterium komossense TaxID=1779 RepID=A0ABT3C634_9MYCO|nr:hypothetical protein [Mycolicibacterium komossense]MCV7224932.1 hypothetical protein [Mycolicibacterium komossense]
MTTHDQDQEVTEFTTAPADFTDGQSRTRPQATDPGIDGEPAPPAGNVQPTDNPHSVDNGQPPAHALPTDDALFAERDLSDLRSRWNDVQATFVDDPRECVQKADSLVSDAVEQLTSSFASARSRLEEQWSRGEEASTEELRLALKRYRDFFDRLLAV